jgi:hypothetical protein
LSAPIAWGPIALGMVLIVLFVRHGLRARRPLIDMHLFRSASFSAAAATTFLLLQDEMRGPLGSAGQDGSEVLETLSPAVRAHVAGPWRPASARRSYGRQPPPHSP